MNKGGIPNHLDSVTSNTAAHQMMQFMFTTENAIGGNCCEGLSQVAVDSKLPLLSHGSAVSAEAEAEAHCQCSIYCSLFNEVKPKFINTEGTYIHRVLIG